MPGSSYTVATVAQLRGPSTRTERLENQDTSEMERIGSTAMANTRQSVHRSGRGDSKKGKKGKKVTDISFSPSGPIDLDSPMPMTPEPEVLTPTQESFDAEQASFRSAMSFISIKNERPSNGMKTLALLPEQFDRLVTALASAPMMQEHVRRQWWEGKQRFDEKNSHSPAETEQTASPPDQDAALGKVSAEKLPGRPDSSDHPRVKLDGIVLVDPKVAGSPIRFVSRNTGLDTEMRRVGQCSFVNIPYGCSGDCGLRVGLPTEESGHQGSRVVLQLVNQVLERKSGKEHHLLVTELDITESFTKAALVELAAQLDMRVDEIGVVTLEDEVRKESTGDIDWGALADELQAQSEVDEIVESAAASCKQLSKESCAMQTLTLMSELTRLQNQHRDFVLVRAYELHDGGTPSRLGAPWMSQHLEQATNDDPSILADALRAFRVKLVSEIAARSVSDGRPWTARVMWDSVGTRVHCEPLVEEAGGIAVAWVGFLRDDYEF